MRRHALVFSADHSPVTLLNALVLGLGDGLNTAGSRWLRITRGSSNRYALGSANIRKQINLKIDHNFNARHKISSGWSFEKSHDERVGYWPFYFQGSAFSRPQVLTINF